MMIQPRGVTVKSYEVASIASGATDTNTTTIAAGTFVEFYGVEVSCGVQASAIAAEITITLGSSSIEQTFVPQSTLALNHVNIGPPANMCMTGGDGDDLVIAVKNTHGSNALTTVDVSAYYATRETTGRF
jgi:hypothetical protein